MKQAGLNSAGIVYQDRLPQGLTAIAFLLLGSPACIINSGSPGEKKHYHNNAVLPVSGNYRDEEG